MRVLQICHKPPVPAVDGGCIAMNTITEGLLQNNCSVKVLAMSTFKHPFLSEKISKEYLKSTNLETIFLDIKINPLKALQNLFTSSSYNIQRFYSNPFNKRLKEILLEEKYDIVVFESLFTTMYLETVRKNSNAVRVYRAHNIEQYIWKHHAKNERNILKKAYLNLLYKRLKNYEIDIIKRFNAIAAINQSESEYFKSLNSRANITTIPFALDVPKIQENKYENTSINLFHIGSMDWTPNQEGIKWLLEEVWPAAISRYPNITLQLAGRSMPEWLTSFKGPNVTIHGEVEDSSAFMTSNDIMIVPLFSASGIRIKILEAMALSKPVICTEIAAKGINYADKKNILIASTKEEFLEVLKDIITNKIQAGEIGKNAHQLMLEEHSSEHNTNKLMLFFNHILNT